MIDSLSQFEKVIQFKPRRWLITGGAGFIGSHLVEELLKLGQHVRVLDNYFSNTKDNLAQVLAEIEPKKATQLELVVGDIRDKKTCSLAVAEVDQVIHLAALGSVPLSLFEPMLCHEINVNGTLNLMLAAREVGIKRFVYASSSAVYGNSSQVQKREDSGVQPLSPYATSKFLNETYASMMHINYDFEPIGLRFFNVFGPRQDPRGPYAAVIPSWIQAAAARTPIFINGDGKTSRDFCYVKDVVRALLLASGTKNLGALGKVFNVGSGHSTDLVSLSQMINSLVQVISGSFAATVVHRETRPGDIQHSCADTALIESFLGFELKYTIETGLNRTVSSMLAQNRPEKIA